MAVDKQPHNLPGHILGTGEFSFAEGAASVAAAQLIGWLDFDNITAFSLTSKNDKVEHTGSYRGTKRLDLTLFKRVNAGYQIKCDALDANKVALLLYGSVGSNYTQVARAAAAVDAIAAPVIGRWYDILVGGVRVREITSIAASVGVEDTDWVMDYKLGRIRSLTATGFGTLTVTAAAITATSATTFRQVTPLNKPVHRGMARITLWNNDGSLVLDHYDFYCEIFPSGDTQIGDNFAELTFDVNVLTPSGTIGTVPNAQQA